MAHSIVALDRERAELRWDLFQNHGLSLREADELAAETLIETIAFAIAWDAAAAAQRDAANWNPEDAPVNNEYRIVEEENRLTILVYRDGAHAGHYIFDNTPAGRAAMRRRIAVLERNFHTRQVDPTDDDYATGDEPPIANPETEADEGPRANARNKAAYHLAAGLRIAYDVNGDALVPSGTRGGIVHRVHHGVCSCEAGQKNRVCWHLEAVRMAEEPRRAA